MRYLSGVQLKHIPYEKDLSTRESTYMIISYMTIPKKKIMSYMLPYIYTHTNIHGSFTYKRKHIWLIIFCVGRLVLCARERSPFL